MKKVNFVLLSSIFVLFCSSFTTDGVMQVCLVVFILYLTAKDLKHMHNDMIKISIKADKL